MFEIDTATCSICGEGHLRKRAIAAASMRSVHCEIRTQMGIRVNVDDFMYLACFVFWGSCSASAFRL